MVEAKQTSPSGECILVLVPNMSGFDELGSLQGVRLLKYPISETDLERAEGVAVIVVHGRLSSKTQELTNEFSQEHKIERVFRSINSEDLIAKVKELVSNGTGGEGAIMEDASQEFQLPDLSDSDTIVVVGKNVSPENLNIRAGDGRFVLVGQRRMAEVFNHTGEAFSWEGVRAVIALESLPLGDRKAFFAEARNQHVNTHHTVASPTAFRELFQPLLGDAGGDGASAASGPDPDQGTDREVKLPRHGEKKWSLTRFAAENADFKASPVAREIARLVVWAKANGWPDTTQMSVQSSYNAAKRTWCAANGSTDPIPPSSDPRGSPEAERREVSSLEQGSFVQRVADLERSLGDLGSHLESSKVTLAALKQDASEIEAMRQELERLRSLKRWVDSMPGREGG